MKFFGLFLVAGSVAAHLHDGLPHPHPPPKSPMELMALQKIEEVCQHDADRHCRPPRETMADPIVQWMFTTELFAPPPIVHPDALDPMHPLNLGPLLDHMMDTALRMPMLMQQQGEPMFVLIFEDQDDPQERAPDEVVLDSMVSRLMQHSTDCDKKRLEEAAATQAPQTPELLTPEVVQHIRLKGQHVLEQEDVPEDKLRLARRLTEVTPEEMMARFMNTGPFEQFFSLENVNDHDEHHNILPHEHLCLVKAREQNKVTPACGDALTRLEHVQKFEIKKNHEMYLYMQFFWFYCILFFALFAMILVRKFKTGKGLFLLRLRVLQAVYSNPEIKAKVEDDIGVPLGNVPPLSNMALKFLSAEGRNQCRRKRERFCRILYLILAFFALDAFGLLPDCWPLFVMGFCCLFMVCRIASICFSKPEVRECKCCCCGGTTSDVENGTVSDVQACCTCCKGTGICSVKCTTCCGGGDQKVGPGSCCGGKCSCAKEHNCDGGCDCCGSKKDCCGSKNQLIAMEEVALFVKDDCKCCCCGGSVLDFATGNVSDVQACCTCCKGTGKCSTKCKTCCGGGGKKGGAGSCCGGNCSCAKEHNCDGSCDCCGSAKKTVMDSNTVVYCGIPVQIV